MGSCHWKWNIFWPAHQNRSKILKFLKKWQIVEKVRFTCLKQMLPRRLLEHSAQLTSFKSTLNTIGLIDISKDSSFNYFFSDFWNIWKLTVIELKIDENFHFFFKIPKIRCFNNFRILDNTQNYTFVMCHICHIRASACHKWSPIIFQSIFILRIQILTSITFTQMRVFVVKYDFSLKTSILFNEITNDFFLYFSEF